MNNTETICLILDTILSFQDLFEVDVDLLYEQRFKLQTPEFNLKTPYPKARFFDFISKEIERQVGVMTEPFRDINKKYYMQESQTDAIVYKLKLIEQKEHNLQEQLNLKPTRRDIFELRELCKLTQNTQEQFIIEQNTKSQQMIQQVDSVINQIVTKQEHQETLLTAQQETIQYCKNSFATKEFSYNKITNLDSQVNYFNEQLLDLKKYSLTNIGNLIAKQNEILSDLTTTVKQHEFQDFLQKSEHFAKKVQVQKVKMELQAKIDNLFECTAQFNVVQQEFSKIIKKTDYEMLQKATKMDWEILRKDHTTLLNQFKKIDQQMTDTLSKVNQFYEFHEAQQQMQIDIITKTVNDQLQEIITEDVQRVMAVYNLEQVQQVIQNMKESLKSKANKQDVLDIFQLKCNKGDIANLENIVNLSTNNIKQFTTIFQEFLELFTGIADLESVNFKKNQISKLANEVNKLSVTFTKINTPTHTHFRSDSEDPYYSTRRTFRTSPKNQVKTFLRPLLSTTYQVSKNLKQSKLNSSNNV